MTYKITDQKHEAINDVNLYKILYSLATMVSEKSGPKGIKGSLCSIFETLK